MGQTGSVRSEEPAERLALIAAALARRGVKFVAIGGWAAQVQDYDLGYETEDIDFTPQKDLNNLDRLSAALKDLGARIWTRNEGSFAFDHNGESLGNAVVWNLICEYGRFDLSFEPAAMGGYEGLVPTARKIFSTRRAPGSKSYAPTSKTSCDPKKQPTVRKIKNLSTS